jgi:hypothetical protein
MRWRRRLALIDVGEVTSWLLEELGGHGIEVGDGVAPEASGWPEGTPNQGTFVEYLVLKPSGPTTANNNDIPLCDVNAVRFALPYRLEAFGVDRVASDNLAATARGWLKDFEGRPVCGDLIPRADQTWITSVMGASRDDSTHPKMWSSITNFTMNVARSR